MDEKYEMLYCDQAHCRVNTFERGEGDDGRRYPGAPIIREGQCPGCEVPGLPVPTRH